MEEYEAADEQGIVSKMPTSESGEKGWAAVNICLSLRLQKTNKQRIIS